MYVYCHMKQQKERFMIDFVVSSILCIRESNDTVYLEKIGIVRKRLFFTILFFVYRKQREEVRNMTVKQKKFADEYLIDGNATQAAVRAGYSKKTAYSQGERLLKNVEVQKYIQEQLDKISSVKIADAKEVMEYLTSVLRGDAKGQEIVVEGCGDGISEAKTMMKAPSEKDKLKAAELLGKRYGLFRDKVEMEGEIGVNIIDDV